MGDFITLLFLDLIAIVVSNWVLLLFFVIALIASKTKRGGMMWFSAGILVRAFEVFGMLVGLSRHPEQGINSIQICGIIGFAVFSIGGALLINKLRRGE